MTGCGPASGAMALTGDADGPALRAPAPVAASCRRPATCSPTTSPGRRRPSIPPTPPASSANGPPSRLRPPRPGLVRRRRAPAACRRRHLAGRRPPRPVDRDAVPAWLARRAGDRRRRPVARRRRRRRRPGRRRPPRRARLLEIPCARVGEAPPPRALAAHALAPARPAATRPAARRSLRAVGRAACAPACSPPGRPGWSRSRTRPAPTGPAAGPAAFLDLLNGGKRSVAVALATADGRRTLRRLLDAADIVVSSSRPRAFERSAWTSTRCSRRSPTVWVAITAHGWDGPGPRPGRVRRRRGRRRRVGGAGRRRPRFLADAVADPLTGVLAAVSPPELLARGGSWFVDASARRVRRPGCGGLGPRRIDAGPPRRLGPGAPGRGPRRPGGLADGCPAQRARILDDRGPCPRRRHRAPCSTAPDHSTASTRPHASAVAASRRAPVSAIHAARARPIRRGIPTVPPAPGTRPNADLGQAEERVGRGDDPPGERRQLDPRAQARPVRVHDDAIGAQVDPAGGMAGQPHRVRGRGVADVPNSSRSPPLQNDGPAPASSTELDGGSATATASASTSASRTASRSRCAPAAG